MILVVIVSVFLYSVLPWGSMGLRVLFKLLLLPVVMGISYELLKWCGRSDNWATRIIRAPGLLVQRLTVFEPDDEYDRSCHCGCDPGAAQYTGGGQMVTGG